MVSISKEGGGTDGRPSRSAVLSFLECSKPVAYIFFGLLVGTMIMNSNQEEKLLRGSNMAHTKYTNMTHHGPPIHIDINFPSNMGMEMNEKHMPSVNVVQGFENVAVHSRLDNNPAYPDSDLMDTVPPTDTLQSAEPESASAPDADKSFMGTFGSVQMKQLENAQLLNKELEERTQQIQTMETQTQMSSKYYPASMVKNQQVGFDDNMVNGLKKSNVANTLEQQPMAHGQFPQTVQYGNNEMNMQQPLTMQSSSQYANQYPQAMEMSGMQQPTNMQVSSQTSMLNPMQMEQPVSTQLSSQMPQMQGLSGTSAHPYGNMIESQTEMTNVDGAAKSNLMMQESMQNVAMPITSETKPIIYTFYEDLSDKGNKDDYDSKIVESFIASWKSAGWVPRVLSKADAMKHPQYDFYLNQLQLLPMDSQDGKGTNRSFYELCFLRWLAMSAVGGGYLSDFDVLPLGYGTGNLSTAPHLELPNMGKFTVYSIVPGSESNSGIPSFMSGTSDEWTRMSLEILTSAIEMVKEGEKHATDMLSMIRLGLSGDKYIVQDKTIDADKVLLGKDWSVEDCSITENKHAVHFSKNAIRNGDSSHFKVDVADRAKLITLWFDQWKNACMSPSSE